MSNQESGFSRSEVTYPAPSSNNGTPSGSMVPLQQPFAAPATAAMGGGGYAPTGPEILHGSLNQTWLMNCLRRRWLLALLMGMLMGVVTAGCLLLAMPESTSVTAYLRVRSKPPTALGESERLTHMDIEMYAQTQLALMKNNRVLKKALGRTDISQLEAVRKEGSLVDSVQWLTDELRVSYQSESEILEVRFAGDEDPEEMVKVIDAVLNAYVEEVLQKEFTERDKVRDALKKQHREVAGDLATKMREYEGLAKIHVDPDSADTQNNIKMLIGELGRIDKQLVLIKGELMEAEVMKSLAIQMARSPTALDTRVQEELVLDQTIASYGEDLYQYDQQLRHLQAQTKRENPQIKQLKAGRQRIEMEMEQYRMTAENKIRQRFKSLPNEQLSFAMIEYNLRKKHFDAQTIELEKDREDKTEKFEALGQGSPELITLKAKIERLQEMDETIDNRLRSWEVEVKAAEDRISVFQPATALGRAFWERYAIASFGGLLALCATCYGVALMEFQRRRLNQPSDIEEGLGIRVLGALPSVASRKALAAGSPVAAQVSESIDNVRATLLHDSTSKERQVILITSPVTMEGSTTVASHLAVSLSRAGRRILLIDGDLRQPSLHKLFGLPLDGGFSEVLRSELDVADAVRPTTTEGLWLMTAGLCDMDAIHALATDQPQPILEKLREEFDFIIIDGAPVLGLSDMLSLGQHVDGAILTVLRDHSEIRKIYQAAELLKSMDIRLIGSVVNGVPQKMDRRIMNLHKAAAKRTPQLPAAAAASAATVVIED